MHVNPNAPNAGELKRQQPFVNSPDSSSLGASRLRPHRRPAPHPNIHHQDLERRLLFLHPFGLPSSCPSTHH